jgi:hypothetical protein
MAFFFSILILAQTRHDFGPLDILVRVGYKKTLFLTPINGTSALRRSFSCKKNKKMICEGTKTN